MKFCPSPDQVKVKLLKSGAVDVDFSRLPRPDQRIDALPECRQRQAEEGKCKYGAFHDVFLLNSSPYCFSYTPIVKNGWPLMTPPVVMV
jgi:hypothetical protein